MENSLRLLILLDKNYKELKLNKDILKDKVPLNTLKDIKENFEKTKSAYIKESSKISEIHKEINDLNMKLKLIKDSIEDKKSKLYNKYGSDIKIIGKLEKDIEKNEINAAAMQKHLDKLLNREKELALNNNKLKLELKKLKDEFVETKAERNNKINDAKYKIAALEEEISNLEQNIDREILSKYHSIKSEKGIAMAQVNKGICLGCKLKLSSITIEKLNEGKEIVFCDNCGKIIYLP